MPRFAISASRTSHLEPAKFVSSTYTTQIIPSFISKHRSKFDCSTPCSSRPDLSLSKKVLVGCLRPYRPLKGFRTRSLPDLGAKHFGGLTRTVSLSSASYKNLVGLSTKVKEDLSKHICTQ